MNVAVKPSEVTCPVILAPALLFRINVEVVTVVPSIFSLNVALMTELAATPVAPPAGVVLVTVGGVLSVDVPTYRNGSAIPSGSPLKYP